MAFDFSSIAGAAGGAAGGSTPWTKIIQMGTKAADGQSGGSGGGGGKGNGMLGKIGARSNMPKEAIMGLGSGLIQQLQASALKKKAQSAMPPEVDARQSSFLAELNQKRKAIDTGADFAAGMNAVDTTNAGTNAAILQAAGGDVGGTMQALLQSERASDVAKNNVLAQGQGQQMAYNSMYGDLNNKIAARQMQLELLRSQQARGEWAAKQQSASQNLMAGVAGLMEQKAGNNAIQTTAPVQNNNTVVPGGGDPNSAFNTGWSFKGAPDKTPANPLQVQTTEMGGKGTPPPITSGTNMLGQGAGAILNLKK